MQKVNRICAQKLLGLLSKIIDLTVFFISYGEKSFDKFCMGDINTYIQLSNVITTVLSDVKPCVIMMQVLTGGKSK